MPSKNKFAEYVSKKATRRERATVLMIAEKLAQQPTARAKSRRDIVKDAEAIAKIATEIKAVEECTPGIRGKLDAVAREYHARAVTKEDLYCRVTATSIFLLFDDMPIMRNPLPPTSTLHHYLYVP